MESDAACMTRRTFVAQTGLIVGGSALLLSGCRQSPVSWQFFTAEEAQLVEVMSGRIIPSDETPGAIEAGVVYFIDQQLSSHYRRWSLVYREALDGIQKIAQTEHGEVFESLDPEQMDRLLERMEDGSLPGELNPGNLMTRFFHRFVDHCMQGYYGDPRHGGNRNWVSYQMLNLRVIDPQSVVPQSS